MSRSQDKDVGTKVVNGQKQRQRRNQKFIAHVEAKTNYYRSITWAEAKTNYCRSIAWAEAKKDIITKYKYMTKTKL